MHQRKLSDSFYLLIFVHAGTMLYDLRPDWIAKALAPLTSHPIGQEKSNRLYSSSYWLAVASVFLAFPKPSPPSKKLVCGFH